MKRKVKLVILGAMLQMSAHAAVQGATAGPSLDRAQKKTEAVKQQASENKKPIAARKHAKKTTAAKLKSKKKQDSLTETPPEATEQSLQFRGLRG